jgi:plastocyanin
MHTLLNDRRLLLPLILTALAIAIGSVLIIVLSDDGSGGGSASGGSTTAQSTGGAAGGAVKISIADYKYMPETVTVKPGTRVTWTNQDTARHTATSGSAFDTGDLDKGDSKVLTLSKPGSFTYTCQFHAFMKGTVVVK